eukprot:5155168-Prymnesium_polylepis.1
MAPSTMASISTTSSSVALSSLPSSMPTDCTVAAAPLPPGPLSAVVLLLQLLVVAGAGASRLCATAGGAGWVLAPTSMPRGAQQDPNGILTATLLVTAEEGAAEEVVKKAPVVVEELPVEELVVAPTSMLSGVTDDPQGVPTAARLAAAEVGTATVVMEAPVVVEALPVVEDLPHRTSAPVVEEVCCSMSERARLSTDEHRLCATSIAVLPSRFLAWRSAPRASRNMTASTWPACANWCSAVQRPAGCALTYPGCASRSLCTSPKLNLLASSANVCCCVSERCGGTATTDGILLSGAGAAAAADVEDATGAAGTAGAGTSELGAPPARTPSAVAACFFCASVPPRASAKTTSMAPRASRIAILLSALQARSSSAPVACFFCASVP